MDKEKKAEQDYYKRQTAMDFALKWRCHRTDAGDGADKVVEDAQKFYDFLNKAPVE